MTSIRFLEVQEEYRGISRLSLEYSTGRTFTCIDQPDKTCPGVQTIVRSKKPLSRLLCFQEILRILRAFKGAYVQTFVRLCPELSPFLFI